MKKVCNRCGHSIEIDKKRCTSCGAFNPYFIAGFNTAPLSVKAERDLLEENRIEMEFVKKENREQKMQRELEEAERRHHERLKQMRIELPAAPKYEAPGKFEPVKGKEPEILNQSGVSSYGIRHEEGIEKILHPIEDNGKVMRKRPAVLAVLVLLLSIGGSFTYFYFTKPTEVNSGALHAEVTPGQEDNNTLAIVPLNGATDDSKANENNYVHKTAVATSAKSEMKPFAVAKIKHPGEFNLTLWRVKNDLVGKKLSGCGITIRKTSDIVSLSNLVFIEELPSGFLKYKVAAKVIQGKGIYNSNPYVYYNAYGNFIKVDGTNCE